jgi:hypothetical protein
MKKYNDLIYYKQDIIDEYSNKRKALEKKDVDDLLRCALLFLEKEAKNREISAIEIPNIGFLHKKINLKNIEKISKNVFLEDNLIVGSAYLETTFLPISMRKDMIENYYPGIDKEELQLIQNNK